ncbi:hypothetical protein JVU11DRAFT_1717 [Chiua virens]|nr:hypothetical protein JVU11DRAFT_1717 [Chiua virens]
MISPPPGYNNGLGMGSSPSPIGQHLQNQQSGALPPQQNAPRGPYAPVPTNQGLLQPLIPTQTGFSSFVPTHHSNPSPFQPQPQPPQPSFLQSHITGFPGNPQIVGSQPTGFPTSGPILSQPTGVNGLFGGLPPYIYFLQHGSTPDANYYFDRGILLGPIGLSPFGQSPFNNIVSTPSPAPANNSSSNTSPANIFAQMKSGTFASGNEHSASQQAVLAQPTGWVPQPTGWGMQPNTGFQSGYTGF